MMQLKTKNLARLKIAKIIWMATVTQNLKPHLIPIWYVIVDNYIWCCTQKKSKKVLNLTQNQSISISLEDGSNPLMGEGTAELIYEFPDSVINRIIEKFDWNIQNSKDYNILIKISIDKWVIGN